MGGPLATRVTRARPTTGPALSIALGAAAWGLFWIPLRYLEELGLPSLWAVSAVCLVSALTGALVLAARREWRQLRTLRDWQIGIALGVACVLYFCGVILSDVVRVILLFYLLPVWTTIAARLLHGNPIRRSQVVVILIALTGVWLLLGGDGSMPLPQNIGDWCGLGAGLCWGISLALLQGGSSTGATASVFIALCIASIVGFVGAAVLGSVGSLDALHLGTLDSPGRALAAITLFGAIVLWPAMFSQVWGARRVPAPTAALLTMTEILVATLSAWWLTGTELGAIALLGGALVITSVLLDIRLKVSH